MYLSSGIQHVIVTWPTYCNVQQGFPLLSSEHLSEGASSLVPYVQCMLPMWPCNNELSITWKCTLLPLCSGGRGRGGDRKRKIIFCVCVCVLCCASWLSMCECVWLRVCDSHMRIHWHTCTYMYTHMHTHVSTRTCTHMHAYVYVCMCVHVCDHVWLYVHVSECQWYSPGRKVTKKKEWKVFCLCMCAHVRVLFIQGWVGDMINIHTHAHNILAYSQDLAAFAMLRPPPPCSSWFPQCHTLESPGQTSWPGNCCTRANSTNYCHFQCMQ